MDATILSWCFAIAVVAGIGASMVSAVRCFNSYRGTMMFGKHIEDPQSNVMFAAKSLRQHHHGKGCVGLSAAKSGLPLTRPTSASASWFIVPSVARQSIALPTSSQDRITPAPRSAAILLSQEKIAALKVMLKGWHYSATGASVPFVVLTLWLRFTIFSRAGATAAAARTI